MMVWMLKTKFFVFLKSCSRCFSDQTKFEALLVTSLVPAKMTATSSFFKSDHMALLSLLSVTELNFAPGFITVLTLRLLLYFS